MAKSRYSWRPQALAMVMLDPYYRTVDGLAVRIGLGRIQCSLQK
jgi:hypothetical protein